MDNGERGMNPVAMTTINPRKEYWQSYGAQLFIFNPFPHNDTFWRPWETRILKTVGKGEIVHNEQFSFSHSVFYPFG